VFFSGAISICAMILPGVSGAFLLKVLGQYDRIIGLISDVVHGQATSESLLVLAVFAGGCLVGLIGFSKLLRWLLASFREMTLAVLCGAMCGSLRVLWPFGNRDLEGGMLPVVLMSAGFVVVLLLDRMTRRNEPGHSEDREE
jgi:putative membrane protein